MSTARTGGGEAKKTAKVSPARNVISLVLLVVVGTTAIVELTTLQRYNSVVSALKKRLPKDNNDPLTKVAERPSRAESEKIIGRAADGPLAVAGSEKFTTYTWHGLIRKHVLTAFYTTDEKPALIRIETGS